MKTNYTTSLETLQHDVASILTEKLKATSPASTADYIAFACDNIEANITRAKEAKKELDAYIKHQESVIETIKIDSAKFLSDNGVDKLEGMRISSITINDSTPSEELVIHSESYWISDNNFTKVTLDKTAIKNFLKSTDIDYSEYAEIVTTHKESKIKINKKRGV